MAYFDIEPNFNMKTKVIVPNHKRVTEEYSVEWNKFLRTKNRTTRKRAIQKDRDAKFYRDEMVNEKLTRIEVWDRYIQETGPFT
jgi:hypothetical protein